MRAGIALLLALLPATATGQPARPPSRGVAPPTPANIARNPSDFPYPTLPWNPTTRPEVHGQVIGYVEVPPSQVTVSVPAPRPESAPFELQQQVVTIPGYYVAETTTGWIYPERWTLEQLNVGVYQWRLLPAEFRRK